MNPIFIETQGERSPIGNIEKSTLEITSAIKVYTWRSSVWTDYNVQSDDNVLSYKIGEFPSPEEAEACYQKVIELLKPISFSEISGEKNEATELDRDIASKKKQFSIIPCASDRSIYENICKIANVAWNSRANEQYIQASREYLATLAAYVQLVIESIDRRKQ